MNGNIESMLAEAVHNHQAGRLGEAEEAYRRILAAAPDHPEGLHFLGLLSHQQGRGGEAVALMERAIEQAPTNVFFRSNLGAVYAELGEAGEAIRCDRRALEIEPDDAVTHYNLGKTLEDAGEPDEAIGSYRRSIGIDARFRDAHGNLGALLWKSGLLDEAVACGRRALGIDPNHAPFHSNLGLALKEQGKLDDAIASFRCAVEIDPGYAGAHFNLGMTFADRGNMAEAMASYGRALAIDPNHGRAAAFLYANLRNSGDWARCEALAVRLDTFANAALQNGTRVPETPLLNIARSTDAGRNLAVAKSWSDDISRRCSRIRLADSPSRGPGSRITVGYLSYDFNDHAVGHLISGLFQHHDRSLFKILAYSSGLDDGSSYRRRVIEGCEEFLDIRGMGHAEAARRIRIDGVDILVDLNGHTTGARLEICAMRPAPVQISYLGFPGTTDADFFDYIVTDRIVTPEESARYFSEDFLYMPDCYLINDDAQAIPSRKSTRTEAGLPENAFVFSSFNQPYKIDQTVFGVWMRLLNDVAGSVLWLSKANDLVQFNFSQAAESSGIDPKRLIFAKRVADKDAHLARLTLADMDTPQQRTPFGLGFLSSLLWALISHPAFPQVY